MKVRYIKGRYEHDITDVLFPTKEQLMAGGEAFVGFTDGKIYDVISIEMGDSYRIMNDSEEDYLWPPEAFEIVEALPAPPVLTEEDYRQGRGDMYMVVKYDIDEDDLAFPEGMTIEDWREGRCEAHNKRKKGYFEYPNYAESLDLEVAEPSTMRYEGVLV